MSISILVERPGVATFSIGLFPEAFYKRSILPLILDDSRFFWLKTLGTGFPVERDVERSLIEELYLLSIVAEDAPLDVAIIATIQQRIVWVLYVLAKEKESDTANIYLG